MAGKKVTIDGLADAIKQICEEYSDDVSLGVSEQAIKIAEVGAQAVNSGSGIFRGRRYKRSWTVQVEGGRYRTSATIHSRVPGLPHLLEYSHSVGDRGGRYSGRPHIAPVEQRIIEQYENAVQNVIIKG